jgi:hypothetical protein
MELGESQVAGGERIIQVLPAHFGEAAVVGDGTKHRNAKGFFVSDGSSDAGVVSDMEIRALLKYGSASFFPFGFEHTGDDGDEGVATPMNGDGTRSR